MGNGYIYIHSVLSKYANVFFSSVLFALGAFFRLYHLLLRVCMYVWGDGQSAADQPYACVKPPRCDIIERSGSLTPLAAVTRNDTESC